MGWSIVFHIGLCSQYLVEPTEKPSATRNHLPNCSLPCIHLRKSLASLGFFPYFMTACENATWYAHVPAGPFGMGPCWMSLTIGSPFSSLILSWPRVAAISPERNARLLLVSSHAKPPSSHASFQKACMNLTDSRVSLLFSTTFLPVLYTSA